MNYNENKIKREYITMITTTTTATTTTTTTTTTTNKNINKSSCEQLKFYKTTTKAFHTKTMKKKYI